jgi:hypothetical protein
VPSVSDPGLKSSGKVVVIALIQDSAPSDALDILILGLIDRRPTAQRRRRRRRAGRHAPQQRQGRPVADAPASPAILADRIFAGKVQDLLEERAIARAEAVGGFLVQALGKGGIRVQVMPDVGTPPLHQMARELAADTFASGAVEIGRQIGEFGSSRLSSERNASSLPLWGVAVTSIR